MKINIDDTKKAREKDLGGPATVLGNYRTAPCWGVGSRETPVPLHLDMNANKPGWQQVPRFAGGCLLCGRKGMRWSPLVFAIDTVSAIYGRTCIWNNIGATTAVDVHPVCLQYVDWVRLFSLYKAGPPNREAARKACRSFDYGQTCRHERTLHSLSHSCQHVKARKHGFAHKGCMKIYSCENSVAPISKYWSQQGQREKKEGPIDYRQNAQQ